MSTDKYTVDIEVRTIDIDGKQYLTITHEVQEAHIPRMFERELSLEAIGVFSIASDLGDSYMKISLTIKADNYSQQEFLYINNTK